MRVKVKAIFFLIMTFYFTQVVGWNVFVAAFVWLTGMKLFNRLYQTHVVENQLIFKED